MQKFFKIIVTALVFISSAAILNASEYSGSLIKNITLGNPQDKADYVKLNPYTAATLAIASAVGAIKLFNINQPENKPVVLHGHTDRISEIAFHPTDETVVASAGLDNTIRIWDCHTADQKTIIRHGFDNEWPRAIAFDPTNSANIAYATARKIYFFGPTPIVKSTENHSWINTLAFDPHDSAKIYSTSYDSSTINCWDTKTDKLHRSYEFPKTKAFDSGESAHIRSFAISLTNPTLLAAACLNQHMYVRNIKKEKPVALNGWGSIHKVLFNPGNGSMLVGHNTQALYVWNIDKSQEIPIILKGNSGYISSAAFDPFKPSILVSVSSDKTVCFWDISED